MHFGDWFLSLAFMTKKKLTEEYRQVLIQKRLTLLDKIPKLVRIKYQSGFDLSVDRIQHTTYWQHVSKKKLHILFTCDLRNNVWNQLVVTAIELKFFILNT